MECSLQMDKFPLFGIPKENFNLYQNKMIKSKCTYIKSLTDHLTSSIKITKQF